MLRLFTALDSSQAVTNQLFALKKEMIGVRWLNPQTYHCTLLYIGDANVYLYRQIKQQLKHIHFRPFSIRVNKFEIFNAINNKPHVLVALVEPNNSLVELQAKINDTISMFHPNLEMHYRYRAHLSIARLTNCNMSEVQDWLNTNENSFDQTIEIGHFSLFSSRSTSSGSVFTKMENYDMSSFYLNGPSNSY
jgi:2'-5' RNA ligase